MQFSSSYRFYSCGDQAITLEFGNSINRDINGKVISLFHFLQEQRTPWIKDIIPSYHTITIVYDLLQVKKIATAGTGYAYVQSFLQQEVEACELKTGTSRKMKIPVCYDPVFGVDLAGLASSHDLTVAEVINLHTSKPYQVYLLGFLPGFAYMGSVDEKIATPRHSSPRTTVAAGSVGIAGEQTGIYPFDSPGGWQIIGRTPLRIFDAGRDQPALLQPGDEIEFFAIDIAEYNNLQQHEHPHS